jgi:hypothetical protein
MNYRLKALYSWNFDRLCLDLAKSKEDIYSHKKHGLTSTEILHLEGLLSGHSPSEIAKELVVKPQSINVSLSNTVYRYVENLTGHPPNSIENWREVAEWLEIAGYRKSASIDWGEAPEVTTFYGREFELNDLKQWILKDRSRLVAILGMGGIGKTTLCTVLAEQIKDEFEWVVWRSLRDCPPIEKLITGLLPNSSQEENCEADLSTFIQYLRDHRCLIVLDEVEGLLTHYPVGYYREGYEAYGEMFRRIGTERHQSCFLITSREKTKEVLLLEEKKSFTRSLQLSGLREAAKNILLDRGLQDENHQWQIIAQHYGGNPLALKIVAETIKELFGGSINYFLKENTHLIESELCEVLDQQFRRLSEAETTVLRQLAGSSQPIPASALKDNTSNSIAPDSLQSICALRRRSLLEKTKNNGEALFSLHPVISKYVKRMYTDNN